jgi:hypothetical protein
MCVGKFLKIFDFTHRGPCRNIVNGMFIVFPLDGFFPYECAWPLYFGSSQDTPEPVFAFSTLWLAGFPFVLQRQFGPSSLGEYIAKRFCL